MKKTNPLKNLRPSEPADNLQQSESKYLKQYRNLCAEQTVPADVDNRVLNHLRAAAEQSAHASACKPTVRKSSASPSAADHSKRFNLRPIAVAAIVLGIAFAGMTVGSEMLRYTWQSIFPEPNPSATASAGLWPKWHSCARTFDLSGQRRAD